MKKNILLAVVVASVFTGCAQQHYAGKSVNIATEPIGAMTKKEIGQKHLHTHSLMQTLQRLGINQGFKTTFTPDSDDAFVGNRVPAKWFDAIMGAQNSDDIEVSGDLLGRGQKTRLLTIRNTRPTVYDAVSNHFSSADVIKGSKFSGKYIISTDEYSNDIISKLYFAENERIKMSRFFDKFYGVARSEGRDIFFALDTKGNIFSVSRHPSFLRMTPYKRQFFINYLNTAGIGYITKGNAIAINDNMTNWTRAMNKLYKLKKYHNAVYAIHDGKNFFEVADSSFQNAPITIELIDWIPGGKREYNIYSHGYHRKIDTDKRFYDYYVPDGSKKYTIRFY